MTTTRDEGIEALCALARWTRVVARWTSTGVLQRFSRRDAAACARVLFDGPVLVGTAPPYVEIGSAAAPWTSVLLVACLHRVAELRGVPADALMRDAFARASAAAFPVAASAAAAAQIDREHEALPIAMAHRTGAIGQVESIDGGTHVRR